MKTTSKIKSFFALSALAIAASFGAPSAAIAGDNDFTLVNKTGYPLREVYISASHKKNWGNDWLGRKVLADKSSKLMKFSDRASCHQDIMVVFDDDGSEVVWEDFNLCEIEKVTLKYNRKSGEVTAVTE